MPPTLYNPTRKEVRKMLRVQTIREMAEGLCWDGRMPNLDEHPDEQILDFWKQVNAIRKQDREKCLRVRKGR